MYFIVELYLIQIIKGLLYFTLTSFKKDMLYEICMKNKKIKTFFFEVRTLFLHKGLNLFI